MSAVLLNSKLKFRSRLLLVSLILNVQMMWIFTDRLSMLLSSYPLQENEWRENPL